MMNEKPSPRPTYALTLEAVPGGDVPATIRLKRFLKAALRGYGLRCTEAREIHNPAPRVASDLQDPPEALPELLDYRPASWELPDAAEEA